MEKIHGNVCFVDGQQIKKEGEKIFIGKTMFESWLFLGKSWIQREIKPINFEVWQVVEAKNGPKQKNIQ